MRISKILSLSISLIFLFCSPQSLVAVHNMHAIDFNIVPGKLAGDVYVCACAIVP